ncbi:MAG: methyltransferase domain-containing protein [Fibrobacteres bacterium]|nr:methyltransferase domain-containing protein [Fibrobacterota bacterium]
MRQSEINTVKSSCAICGATEATVAGELTFALPASYRLDGNYAVLACNCCGMVISKSSSEQKDYDRFYAGTSYSPAYKTTLPDENEHQYLNETAAIISAHVKKADGIIADIGTGISHLPLYLKQAGMDNVVASDLSMDCINILKSEMKVNTLLGDLATVLEHHGNINFLVMSHIMEHFADLGSIISLIRNKLQPGSRIFVEVPATDEIETVCPEKPLSYLYYTHLNHFDEIHLNSLMTVCGCNRVAGGRRIREEKGIKIPAVWAVFERESKMASEAHASDFRLAVKIAGWFKNSSLDPSSELYELAKSMQSVYVWGMGIHANQMLGMSPLKDCNIKGLLDGNVSAIGSVIGKFTVESSEKLKQLDKDECVVITAPTQKNKMVSFLRESIGFRGRIVTI